MRSFSLHFSLFIVPGFHKFCPRWYGDVITSKRFCIAGLFVGDGGKRPAIVSLNKLFNTSSACDMPDHVFDAKTSANSVLAYIDRFEVHYSDVIMTTMASLITSFTVVYLIVYSNADQWKHQCSALLAFVRGIHRWPVNSPYKGLVTRKMFSFDDVSMMLESQFWIVWIVTTNFSKSILSMDPWIHGTPWVVFVSAFWNYIFMKDVVYMEYQWGQGMRLWAMLQWY